MGSLRWRHAYDRTYDANKGKELTGDEIDKLSPDAKADLTRKLLTADQIEALLKTAIELHSRAIATQEESRWWIPIIASFIGGILGAIIGAALGGS